MRTTFIIYTSSVAADAGFDRTLFLFSIGPRGYIIIHSFTITTAELSSEFLIIYADERRPDVSSSLYI